MGGHKFRELDGFKGRQDYYSFDPRLLKVDPSYNVRDLSTPEAKSKLAELKEQIRHAGVRVPLEVRMQDDDVLIVSGHRRHRAVMELIEEGVEIESVPVFREPQGTDEIERTLNLALSNSGEPLTQLELARVVKRLADFGWEHAQIAKRMGWKSNGSVRQHLDLLELPPAIQAAVKRGDVSSTMARKTVADIGAEATAKIIADNAAQGKKTRPRDVPAKPKKTKAAEKAERFRIPAAPPQEQPAAQATIVGADNSSPLTTERRSGFLVCDGPVRFQPVDPSQQKAMSEAGQYLAAPITARHIDADVIDQPSRAALNGFYSAVEPIAKALDHVNWDEVEDDGMVTVYITGRNAKLFIQAWTRATGEA